MDLPLVPLLALILAALLATGCTTPMAAPVVTVTHAPGAETTPAAPAPSVKPGTACTQDSDCVPSGCCHAAGCIPSSERTQVVCNMMCTTGCLGPLDCGAGSCGCTGGTCRVIPADKTPGSSLQNTSLSVRVSPQFYSPIMSSTPGIGLEPVITGSIPANTTFIWNATYGRFLSWGPPAYTIGEKGDSAVNHGEKLYWSFSDAPTLPADPVIITVSAMDPRSGQTLGSSRVVLSWEGNHSVQVTAIG